MQWNTEQLEAINTLGKNTTVSASAGAGKTAVLVERLMKRILVDRVSIDEIVALTFTDAAAAEMKNRLILALNQELAKQPDDEYLQRQLALVADAKITTIHSFCLSLLKDHYYMLELSPEALNNILDDAKINDIKEKAYQEVFQNFDHEQLVAVQSFLSNSSYNFSRFKNIVFSLAEEASTKTDPDAWLNRSTNNYQKFEKITDLPDNLLSNFFNLLRIQVKRLEKIVITAMTYLDQTSPEINTSKQAQYIDNIYQSIPNLNKALLSYDYETFRAYLIEIAQLENPSLRGDEGYKSYRATINDILNELISILYPEEVLLDALAINQPIINSIICFTKKYLETYEILIIEAKGITFNHMETLAYRLLTMNNYEVAKSLQKEITDILVDEFQDTNPLQNEIINLISRGNNVFRVGDVKQSIYRFRGAKPQIMQELIEEGNSENHHLINLKHNYRSKKSIVEFNNHIFNNLMNLEEFSSSYTIDDLVSVGVSAQKNDSVPVELHLVNKDKEAYLFDKNQTANEIKANYIANKISSLYQSNDDYQWNDFVVLVQSNQQKTYMRDAFEAINVPYFISMPDGFYDSFGVSVTIAYLECIINKNSIALMTVLKHLYQIDEEEIAQSFLARHDLLEVAKNLAPELLKDLDYFRNREEFLTLTDILNHIFAINNFYEEKLSHLERVNLDLFYESALEYQRENVGIKKFLLEIEKMKEEKTSEAIALTSEDDVVNVMTFHNSKGLQFDTVFVWSKNRRRSPQLSEGFMIDADFGLALKTTLNEHRLIQDNIVNYVIQNKDNFEELEEEMRTLYVALTRAQRRMIIVDLYDLEDNNKYYDFSFTDILDNIGFTGWIKAIQDTNPTKHLLIKEIDSFNLVKQEETVKEEKMIIKNPAQKNPTDMKTYTFPLTPLDFEEELGFNLGTLVHEAIEKSAGKLKTADQIKQVAPTLSDYFVEKIVRLNNSSFMEKLIEQEHYFERPFIFPDDTGYQRGIIDFIAIDDETVTIIDFKTDSEISKDELVTRYKNQMDFYISAMAHNYPGHQISAYIYSVYYDEFISL